MSGISYIGDVATEKWVVICLRGAGGPPEHDMEVLAEVRLPPFPGNNEIMFNFMDQLVREEMEANNCADWVAGASKNKERSRITVYPHGDPNGVGDEHIYYALRTRADNKVIGGVP